MLRDRLKESFLLKAISYIVLPILILIVVASGIILAYHMEYPEIKDKKDFYDTEFFSNLYTNRIIDIYTNLESITNSNNYYNIYDYEYDTNTQETKKYEESYEVKQYEIGAGNITAENTEKENTTVENIIELVPNKNDGIYYSTRFTGSGIKYLILNKDDKCWYTNLDRTSKTDTVEEIKQVLLSGTRYWNLKGKNVETNIEELISENIMRGSIYEKMINSNMEIYTAYVQDEDKTNYMDFAINKDVYNFASQYYDTANIALPISMVSGVIVIIYLIVSCGHKKRSRRNISRLIR